MELTFALFDDCIQMHVQAKVLKLQEIEEIAAFIYCVKECIDALFF